MDWTTVCPEVITVVNGARTFLTTRLSTITRVVTVESVVPCQTCSGPNYPAPTPIMEPDHEFGPGIVQGAISGPGITEESQIQAMALTGQAAVVDQGHDLQGVKTNGHDNENCPKCSHGDEQDPPMYTPPTQPRPGPGPGARPLGLSDDEASLDSASYSHSRLQTPSQNVVTGAATTENGAIRDWIYAAVFALLLS